MWQSSGIKYCVQKKSVFFASRLSTKMKNGSLPQHILWLRGWQLLDDLRPNVRSSMGIIAYRHHSRLHHPTYHHRQHPGDSGSLHVQAVEDRAELLHSVSGCCRFNSGHSGLTIKRGLFSGGRMGFRDSFVQNVAHVRRDVLHCFNSELVRHRSRPVLGHYWSHQLRSEANTQASLSDDCCGLVAVLADFITAFDRVERLAGHRCVLGEKSLQIILQTGWLFSLQLHQHL